MRITLLNKKGQLEIGIKIMVLIVFLVLLIISLIVYFKFSYVSIQETKDDILDEKFSSLVNVMVNLPELKCSMKNIERECLDAKKLIAFGIILGTEDTIKERYIEDLGVNKIEVEIVYPTLSDELCNWDNHETCKTFILIDGNDEGLKYTTPVSVYFPENEEYKIGKLIITANI